jgi:hypothetical protein
MIALARLILATGFACYLAAGWLYLAPAGQAGRQSIVNYIGSL